METLAEVFIEALKFIAPAAAALTGIWLIQKDHAAKDRQAREQMFRAEWLKQLLPLRTAAYERSVLFLERLRPEQMVLRLGTAGKTSDALHMEMLLTVRDEFEHNLVQQLYVAPAGWDALVKAKEEVQSLVNDAYRETGTGMEALVFAKHLLGKLSALPTHPCQIAINTLKDGFMAWTKA